MADITGNPTPLNVPVPADASGTLTPKQGDAASPATAPTTPGAPITTPGTSSGPSAPNVTPPPAVPDLT